ncbi:MAG: hypothetical protein AAFX79_06470 [Planctomycetota bacterium]
MASRRPPLFELLQASDHGREPASGSPASGSPASGPPASGPGRSTPTPGGPPSSGRGEASGAGDAAASKAAPPTRPRPKRAAPRRKPAAPRPRDRTNTSATAGEQADWSSLHPKRAVQIPLVSVYVGVTVLAILVIGVWTLAYQLGKDHAEQRFARLDTAGATPQPLLDPLQVDEGAPGAERTPESASGTIADPTRGGAIPVDPTRSAEPPRAAERTRIEPPAAGSDPADGSRASAPSVLVDVRKPDHNYLKLASGMARERAVGLAEHLARSGVPAMAIDEGRGRFGLYSSLGVPGERFRSTLQERNEHEQRVRRLLAAAPDEAGGSYDLRDPFWARYRP